MRWIVEGADAATGEDRAVRVHGPSAALAEQVARLYGLYVCSVAPASSPFHRRRPLPPALPYGLVVRRPPPALSPED